MSAIRKIIKLQGPHTKASARPSREASRNALEKGHSISTLYAPEEVNPPALTPVNRVPSRDSTLLSRNRTLAAFIGRRSDRSPKMLESAIGPSERSKNDLTGETSVERTIVQNPSSTKSKITILPRKNLTILTRKPADKSPPHLQQIHPNLHPQTTTNAKPFPGFYDRSTTSGTGEQKFVTDIANLRSATKPFFQIPSKRTVETSLDRIKNRLSETKQMAGLRFNKTPPPDLACAIKNSEKDEAPLTKTLVERKPFFIPRDSKINAEKSKSIDFLKKIFTKKSTEPTKATGNRSEDKEANRFGGGGPNLNWLKRPVMKTLVEENRTPKPPEVSNNFHYMQLKRHIEVNDEAKRATKIVRQMFAETARLNPNADLFAFKTSPEFYKIKSRLGKGCFGEVYLATQVLTGCQVALKVIPKMSMKNRDSRKKIEKEVSFLQQTSGSDCIIHLLEVFEDSTSVYLVFEYAPNGDLVRYFEKNQLFSEDELRPFFAKILRGVQHLHACHIIHRDIKLDNILLDRNMEPKLCDFGISTAIEPGKKIYDTGGTPAYLAPEVIKSEGEVCEKTDVWSLGVLLYLLSFGQVPFKANDMQVLYHKILSGKFQFHGAEGSTPELLDLITKMLTVEVSERISLTDVLEHPWLSGHQSNQKTGKKQDPDRVALLNSVIAHFLGDAGFPDHYVRRSLEVRQSNHVRACYDLLMDKYTK